MNRVYTISYEHFDGNEIFGTYTTLELAQSGVTELNSAANSYVVDTITSYEINSINPKIEYHQLEWSPKAFVGPPEPLNPFQQMMHDNLRALLKLDTKNLLVKRTIEEEVNKLINPPIVLKGKDK